MAEDIFVAGSVAFVPLTGRRTVVVDAEDASLARRFDLSYDGHGVVAQVTDYRGRGTAVYLAALLSGARPGHVALQINGDVFDLRKVNLRNIRPRKPRGPAPTWKDVVLKDCQRVPGLPIYCVRGQWCIIEPIDGELKCLGKFGSRKAATLALRQKTLGGAAVGDAPV